MGGGGEIGDPPARAGHDRAARRYVEDTSVGLYSYRAAQNERVLVESRALRGFGPATRGDHVGHRDFGVAAAYPADVLVDDLSAGHRDPRRLHDQCRHVAAGSFGIARLLYPGSHSITRTSTGRRQPRRTTTADLRRAASRGDTGFAVVPRVRPGR